jgi:hypothetical protein
MTEAHDLRDIIQDPDWIISTSRKVKEQDVVEMI